MKLSKAKLIKLLRTPIEKLGFTEIRDTCTGAQGLFIQKLESGLFLSLGLTISRYRESMFTASFYLSKTTRWASIWGDIPNRSYSRISNFLTDSEMKKIEENCNVKDIWWYAENKAEINNFLTTIEVCRERFLKQPDLIKEIENSINVTELHRLSMETISTVKLKKIDNSLNFQPIREIDKIPLIWFMAAETVIKKSNFIINKNTVKHLASDSWKQQILNENFNKILPIRNSNREL